MKLHSVKLHPKTNKAKNKINEAGKPEHWLVLEERDFVAFSDRSGPWLYIQPENNLQQNERWVSTTDDPDFTVEVVR